MNYDRVGAAAVSLSDGRVLIVGGKSGKVMVGMRTLAGMAPLKTAEISDPEAGVFVPTGNMSAPHYLATATMLNNGNVLVVGGCTYPGTGGRRDARCRSLSHREQRVFARGADQRRAAHEHRDVAERTARCLSPAASTATH